MHQVSGLLGSAIYSLSVLLNGLVLQTEQQLLHKWVLLRGNTIALTGSVLGISVWFHGAAEASPLDAGTNKHTNVPVTSLFLWQTQVLIGSRVGGAWPRPHRGFIPSDHPTDWFIYMAVPYVQSTGFPSSF